MFLDDGTTKEMSFSRLLWNKLRVQQLEKERADKIVRRSRRHDEIICACFEISSRIFLVFSCGASGSPRRCFLRATAASVGLDSCSGDSCSRNLQPHHRGIFGSETRRRILEKVRCTRSSVSCANNTSSLVLACFQDGQ